MNILFVCLGNTCRSPMMERMFLHMTKQRGLDYIHAESAGLLKDAAKQPMAEFSQKELESRGIDASGHTARFIGTLTLTDYDFIITVGEMEAVEIQKMPTWSESTPILILGGSVPNPWEKGEEAYHSCAAHIEAYMPNVVEFLLRTQ